MPTNRYIVAPELMFNYCPDPVGRQIIKNAGGRRNLTEEQKPLVKLKTVFPGQDCSDMDPVVRELYVKRGWIQVVEEKDPPKAKAKAKDKDVVTEDVISEKENE